MGHCPSLNDQVKAAVEERLTTMTNFAISFRIARKGDHQDRYQSLVDKIDDMFPVGERWDETTSFVLVSGVGTAKIIGRMLYFGTLLNAAYGDTVLVIDLDSRTHAAFGEVQYPHTLASFFIAERNALAG